LVEVILPAVLYGYKTWSLILSKEHRVKAFKDRVLKVIFGPKRDEITGGWRELHSEKLQNLYISSNISGRRMRPAGYAACIGINMNGCKVLVGQLVVKRPLRRYRHRLENNIKTDLREKGWGGTE
jgi:hypothetical protein